MNGIHADTAEGNARWDWRLIISSYGTAPKSFTNRKDGGKKVARVKKEEEKLFLKGKEETFCGRCRPAMRTDLVSSR